MTFRQSCHMRPLHLAWAQHSKQVPRGKAFRGFRQQLFHESQTGTVWPLLTSLQKVHGLTSPSEPLRSAQAHVMRIGLHIVRGIWQGRPAERHAR